MSVSPAPETRATLKRRITVLEEENAQLVSKIRKTPVHSYVHEGRAIRRIVSLADPVTNLIAEYDRHIMLEEDEDNIELVASSDEEQCTFHSFKKLVQWCPSVKKLMQNDLDGHDLALACQELKKGADGARGDDANTLKISVATWLNEQQPHPPLPLSINEKNNRGFNHELTGRLLCPVDYDWLNSSIRDAIREFHPRYPVTAHGRPAFLYRKAQYNPQRPSMGLFKGELLVRAFRCIFMSPSSAHEELEAEHEDGQPRTHKARKTARGMRPRGDVAGLLRMRSVQPRAIAYIAVQVRFALLSSSFWELKDDNFDYEIFYHNIVDWFECPRSDVKRQDIEELLLWWNRAIFGRQPHALQPGDIASQSVSMSMV